MMMMMMIFTLWLAETAKSITRQRFFIDYREVWSSLVMIRWYLKIPEQLVV